MRSFESDFINNKGEYSKKKK